MVTELVQHVRQDIADAAEHPSQHVGELLCLAAVAGASIGGLKIVANVAKLATEERSAQLAIDNLPSLLETTIPSNPTHEALEMRLSIDAGGGIKRALTVHIPPGFDAAKENAALVGFDSTQLNRPAGALNKINGLGATSDKYGFLSVFPEQAPQARLTPLKWAGKSLTSWNAEGLPLNYRPKLGNDVQLVRNIVDALPKAMKVDPNRFVLTGFSDGAWLVNKAVSTGERLPVSGVASISGSLAESDMPQAHLKGLFVRGTNDLNFPAIGGAGKNTSMLKLFGHTNINTSRPALQAEKYASASGLTKIEPSVDTELFTEHNFSSPQSANAPVREYVIKRGGHTWHGRAVGEGAESEFSPTNGRPLNSDEFSVNEKIAQYFDLGGKVRRSLAITD
ncbi:MAG TPA: hypothetical protein V6C81_29820 [Planktothrix sp.]|jgi:poly(3-hydroxybutyrate) depolymerase